MKTMREVPIPTTREEARAMGSVHYRPEVACKHGHLALRLTSNQLCLECCKAYSLKSRAKNLERCRARDRDFHHRNREHRRQYKLERYRTHRETVCAQRDRWREKNKHKDAASTARRKAAKLRATPAWADHQAIETFYIEAARLTQETGIKHEVDHIVPLQSEMVCGLHVHWNLQVLTQAENCRKFNRLIDHARQEGR